MKIDFTSVENFIKKSKDYNLFYLAIIFLLWLSVIIAVNPIGDFPTVDDFAYGGPIKHYLETGNLRLTDWSSMTLIAHIYIGIFVSKLFGFSFTVLRLTNLVFELIVLSGLYLLGLEIIKNKLKAFLIVLIIAFNPCFLSISFTFYTDITFLAFLVYSILFYVKYLKNNTLYFFLIAIILNIIALLIREIAIVASLGFAFAYIYSKHKIFKDFKIGLFPVLLAIIVYLSYRYWFTNFHGITKNSELIRNKFISVWTSDIGYFLLIYSKNLLYTTVHYGFYLLPVTFLALKEKFKFFSMVQKIVYAPIIIIISIIILFLLKTPKIFDSFNWILNNHYMDYMESHLGLNTQSIENSFIYPSWLIIVMIFIGVIGGVTIWMLLYNLIKEKIFKNNKFVFLNLNPVNILLLSSIVIYCVPTYTLIIDPRYLIFPLIIIGLYLLSNTGYMKVNRTFQFLIVFTLAFYIYDSVSCIHDNMLKGRIRRDALNYLENDLQISPDKIDGGFEYNAWHFYKPDFQETNAKKWWYVYDDEYIVTNNINKEYILLKSYDVPRWQPSGFVCKVYIWKRKQ